jgi:hypothetical protein
MKSLQLFAACAFLALAPTANAQFVPGPLGVAYCTATANSTGQPGVLMATGVAMQVAGHVDLLANQCPPGQMGLFFYGDTQAAIPFMDGTFCVSPAAGITRLNPPVMVGTNGSAARLVGGLELGENPWTGGPLGGGWLTLNYQFWFRDPAAMGTGANLTNALQIDLSPCITCF